MKETIDRDFHTCWKTKLKILYYVQLVQKLAFKIKQLQKNIENSLLFFETCKTYHE